MKIETLKEDIKAFAKSKYFNRTIFVITFFVWTGLVLQLGMIVGFQKASYFFKYGDSYYKNIRGPKMMPMGLQDNDLPRSHGAIGKVIQVSLPTIVIEDKDGLEKTIRISNGTMIKKSDILASSTDISENDFAVVIGVPNDDAVIEAKFIRILPPLDIDNDNK